jgi:hypothetical protein
MECVRIIPYTLFIPNNDARKTWRPRMLISRVILAPFECTGLIWENIIVVAWISAPDKKTSGMFRARIAGFVCHSTAAVGIKEDTHRAVERNQHEYHRDPRLFIQPRPCSPKASAPNVCLPSPSKQSPKAEL